MNTSPSNPYYIIAPPYNRTSAGIRVLYKLADMINKNGHSAFIYLRPNFNTHLASSPFDVAPFLTQKIIDYHFKNNLTPIIIYPETINVRKFTPPVRVRYLLNYHNYLYKNESLEEDNFLLFYSHNISEKYTGKNQFSNLFIPISDHHFFCPPETNQIRKGACFYAGKYKDKFNGKTFPITNGLTEITRDKTNSQSPEEIKHLFQTCELFYCYEDTALALEAMLCGCPTVWLPNEFFKKSLGSQEILGLGTAWGNSPDQISYAKNTVHKVREQYIKLISNSNISLLEFINKTQLIAQSIKYETKFLNNFPIEINIFSYLHGYILMIVDSINDRGINNVIMTIVKRILNGRIHLNSK